MIVLKEQTETEKDVHRCLSDDSQEEALDTVVTPVTTAGTTSPGKAFFLSHTNTECTASGSGVVVDDSTDVTTPSPLGPDVNTKQVHEGECQETSKEDDIATTHPREAVRNSPPSDNTMVGRENDDNPSPPQPDDNTRTARGDSDTPTSQGGELGGMVGATGGVRRRSTRAIKCTYTKKGVCHIHGSGAIEKWRPSFVIETGPDGVKTRRYTKKKMFVCDLDLDGKKLLQPRLSFSNMTMNDRRGGATVITEGGGGDLRLSTSKVGQSASCVQPGTEKTDR